MFQASNISKVFKSGLLEKDFHALENVDFKVHSGRATGFLGANGAGKTTFIKILMGFISSTNGKVEFDKKMGASHEEALKKIGYIPERPFYYQYLSGRDFLYYMGRLSELSNSKIDEKIQNLASRLKIDFALDREIKGYSKGMLQRLGFLSSLIHDPELLVFDEPLSGLDPIGRRDLKDVLLELLSEGKTIFMSSHIISDIEEVCQDVVVLEKGTLIYEGDIKKLLDKGSSQKSKISYINSFGEFKQEKVMYEKVNSRLQEIIADRGIIQDVTKQRPRLEEIVYKV